MCGRRSPIPSSPRRRARRAHARRSSRPAPSRSASCSALPSTGIGQALRRCPPRWPRRSPPCRMPSSTRRSICSNRPRRSPRWKPKRPRWPNRCSRPRSASAWRRTQAGATSSFRSASRRRARSSSARRTSATRSSFSSPTTPSRHAWSVFCCARATWCRSPRSISYRSATGACRCSSAASRASAKRSRPIAGCGQAPIKPAANHLRAEDAPAASAIPAPVQVTPVLPKPRASVRPETYSVVVNNVRVQELLFALARDARLQIDIDPNLTGTVTLNAIDQTLPQLLGRIARQVDMRYELDGDTLMVMRDSPFLRSYKIDYLSAARIVKMQSTASTQFGSSQAGGPTATGATSTIDVAAQNNLWESIVQNLKEILRETDKIIPAPSAAAAPSALQASAGGVTGATPPPPLPGRLPLPQPSATYQEAASVIANRESGVLYVRATSKQHEQVQEFLDQVMAGAKRQVLIEATVAEVQLRNEYQRGIEWSKLPNGASGLRLNQPAIPPTTSSTPPFNPNPFVIGFVSTARNISITLTALEQFGDVRVLSSPKMSVLNNQTAVLRVTRDIIYFSITPSTQPITIATGAGAQVQASFTTTPNVAAEGFMMAVLPQINDTD